MPASGGRIAVSLFGLSTKLPLQAIPQQQRNLEQHVLQPSRAAGFDVDLLAQSSSTNAAHRRELINAYAPVATCFNRTHGLFGSLRDALLLRQRYEASRGIAYKWVVHSVQVSR